MKHASLQILVAFLCLFPTLLNAQIRVLLQPVAIESSTREQLQQQTASYLNAINEYRDTGRWPAAFSSLSKQDQKRWKGFIDSTAIYLVNALVEPQLVFLSNGSYELRQMDVMIEQQNKQYAQELILTLNPARKVTDFRLAMDLERYEAIIQQSRSVQDRARRQQIIQYLEHFRTAYSKKDIKYIEQQFSEQALIIVGNRVESAKQQYVIENVQDQQKQVQFRLSKYSKKEYIKRLKEVIFKKNAYLELRFKDIKVKQHPDFPEIYGVHLFQEWRSSTYSDEGYLYLMIDYEDEQRPLIYVRAWQDRLFEDLSTFDHTYFRVVK